jgi:hypothetical protein
MKRIGYVFLVLVGFLLVSVSAYAYDLNSITLDELYVSGPNGTTVGENLLTNPPPARIYSATDASNPTDSSNDSNMMPSNNIGEYNDGLLNNWGLFPPNGAFIDVGDLQDLDGDGFATDPGWIHLAEIDTQDGSIIYDSLGKVTYSPGIPIESLLTFTVTWDPEFTAGRWMLWTDPAKMDEVLELLGPSTFDHLAFSIKAANDYIVYDFNFKDIFASEVVAGNTSLNFTTAYTLGGTFQTLDFTNQNGQLQDISHLNVWARDPKDPVPEPTSMILLGTGLIGMAGIWKRKFIKKNSK